MSVTPVLEALRQAQQERASGCLTLSAGPKRTVLWLHEGAVVAAEVGFGYQASLQARLLSDQLSLAELDALWARGGVPEEDEPVLEQRQRQDESLRWLFTLRRAVALAEEARLQLGEPQGQGRAFEPLPLGALVGDEALPTLSFDGFDADGGAHWKGLLADAAQGVERGEAKARTASPESWVASSPAPPEGERPSAAQSNVNVELDVDLDVELEPAGASVSAPAGAGAEPEPWTTLERSDVAMTLEDQWASAFGGPDAETGDARVQSDRPVDGDNPDSREQTSWSVDGAETSLSEEDDLANEQSDDPAVAARARRQRLLRRAMENMGVMGPRAAEGAVPLSPSGDEAASSAVTPSPQASPAGAAVAASSAPASVPGAKATVVSGTEDQKLDATIRRRYEETLAKKGDPFGVLGLPRTATKEQVKAAYLELAKSYHPDRLPGALASLSSQMTVIFEAIRSAYEVLYDDAKRAAFLRTSKGDAAPLGSSAAPKTPVEQALELVRIGELQLKKREFVAAEGSFMKAHGLSPKGEYLAAAGWAVYTDPARREELSRAMKLMTDALKIDPTCHRAHYQLGVVARVEGDMEKAERHFRETVRLNPKHLEANQELRLLEMRKRGGKRGLFR